MIPPFCPHLLETLTVYFKLKAQGKGISLLQGTVQALLMVTLMPCLNTRGHTFQSKVTSWGCHNPPELAHRLSHPWVTSTKKPSQPLQPLSFFTSQIKPMISQFPCSRARLQNLLETVCLFIFYFLFNPLQAGFFPTATEHLQVTTGFHAPMLPFNAQTSSSSVDNMLPWLPHLTAPLSSESLASLTPFPFSYSIFLPQSW